MAVSCAMCQYYRIPQFFTRSSTFQKIAGSATSWSDISKLRDDEMESYDREAKEHDKLLCIPKDEVKYPSRPRYVPYCGLKQCEGCFLVAQRKNSNSDCKDFKHNRGTSDCQTCIYREDPIPRKFASEAVAEEAERIYHDTSKFIQTKVESGNYFYDPLINITNQLEGNLRASRNARMVAEHERTIRQVDECKEIIQFSGTRDLPICFEWCSNHDMPEEERPLSPAFYALTFVINPDGKCPYWQSKYDTFDVYYQHGVSHFECREFEQAIADFTRAIELKPYNNADAYHMRGASHFKRGEFEQAIADFTRVIELKPDDKGIEHTYHLRGLSHFERSEFEQAIADFTRVIELKPDHALAYCYRGEIYYKQDRLALARADLDQALKLQPSLGFTISVGYPGLRKLRAEKREIDGGKLDHAQKPKSEKGVDDSKLPDFVTVEKIPQHSPDLKSEKGVDYTQLRDLLAAGKWKEADQETHRVMCLATGREKEGWLQDEDIDNFPCEDLRSIDQLWLHYSNGKFGFSVQKKIYQSLVGMRDYNQVVYNQMTGEQVYNKELLEKFSEVVGWKKEGIGLGLLYSALTFNLSAPEGHLPALGGMLWSGFLVAGQILIISQRLLICKIYSDFQISKPQRNIKK